MDDASPGRFDAVPEALRDALVLVRDAARACLSAYPREQESRSGGRGEVDAGRTQARGLVQEVFVTAERMAAGSDADVLWLTEGGDRLPPRLCVAPLQVWGPMRDKLLSDKTAVFTSATLMLGGDFSSMAVSVGLRPAERVVESDDVTGRSTPSRPTTRCRGEAWTPGRPSTTAGRRSSTSPGTFRRPVATASARRSSTRSSSSSTRPRGARWGCSAHGVRPRRRPPRCASGCRT